MSYVDFENGSLAPAGWTIGAQLGGSVVVSADSTRNAGGSKGSLKAIYPMATAGMYAWAQFDLVPFNTREAYIEFDVKIPNDANGKSPGAAKFLKFFGQNGNGYANTTFGLSGDAGQIGSLTYIGFGDGDGNSTENDVGNVILLTGEYPNWIGRSYGKANVYNKGTNWNYWDWKDQWHHFRVHAKFHTSSYNTATGTCVSEVNDGEYYLEIDGVPFVNAKGLFNHHCSNLPLSHVKLLDWGGGTFGPFEINLDNIRITTGGFLSGPKKP